MAHVSVSTLYTAVFEQMGCQWTDQKEIFVVLNMIHYN